MINLKESQVIFDEELHRYTLNGRELSGITSMLSRQLFADKYNNVPVSVLDAAKERGTKIHELCELVDDIGIETDESVVLDYISLCAKNKLNYECSEYLVSDNEHYASCIDKVYWVSDTEFILGDIKTTYALDVEYLRWQLSIYAYLFELQNPGCKAVKLLGIWLKEGKSKMIEIERIPNDIIINLMAKDIAGEQFDNPLKANNTPPEEFGLLEHELNYIIGLIKSCEAKKEALIEEIQTKMQASGADKWSGKLLTVSRRKGSVRKVFDKKRFEEEYPGVYETYTKESETKESLTIKINQYE